MIQIIGWMGFDYEYNRHFPETFSLFIAPKYRGYGLSLWLKHSVYSILKQKNIVKSYSRMEASHNQELINYNLNSGLYRMLVLSETNADWRAMCARCELFKKNCKEQIYLEADVTQIFPMLNKKISSLSRLNLNVVIPALQNDPRTLNLRAGIHNPSFP